MTDEWKRKLVELVLSYQDAFPRDKLECGEAKDFLIASLIIADFPSPHRRVPTTKSLVTTIS